MASASSANDYQAILADYQEDLEHVEKAITHHFDSDVTLIPRVSSYLIGAGGKRIRPLLVMMAARLSGYTGGDRHITLSVVAEYIHAATLLHDDVVDEAQLRRGAASANHQFGNEASVLVGDFLFAKSFTLMAEDDDIRIIKAMAGATKKLAEGEILQLANTCDINLDEAGYMDTIYRKTGALMEACCRVGALLGDASAENEEALATYGKKIGIAFQLVDDALDYTADQEKWGKPIGADLVEGKITLPLIKALERVTDDEKKVIQEALDANENHNVAAIRAILDKHGTLDLTMNRAYEYINAAKGDIAHLPESNHRDALYAVADYVVSRTI